MKPTIHPRYRDIKNRTLVMLEESDQLDYAVHNTCPRDACSINVSRSLMKDTLFRIVLSGTESGSVGCRVKIGRVNGWLFTFERVEHGQN